MKLTVKYYGPAILWALFILIICLVPFGKVSSSHLFFPGFDKLTHCGLFFVLSVLYCTGSMRKWKSYNLRIEVAVKNTIVMISYGAFIEVLQNYLFTWRSGEWNDLFCDTIGACMGIFSVIITAMTVNINHEKI